MTPIVGQEGSEQSPLEISDFIGVSHPIEFSVGQTVFAQLRKSGGTGYFWEPVTENQQVLRIQYIRSASTKKSDEVVVGRPEVDIFRVNALAPGDVAVPFDLKRIKGPPIESVTVKFHVTGSLK